MIDPRIIVVFILLLSHFPTSFTEKRGEQYSDGQNSYNKLRSDTDSHTGSKCMENAFSQLNSTCSSLEEEIALTFLALKFTLCHYQASQRELPPACSKISNTNESITNCTKSLSDSAFLAYTQFYTHTRASCYYLEEKLWQEKTDTTISRLGDVAEESADKIQKSLINNDQLIEGQKLIYEKASQLNEQQDSMQEKLDENHSKMDKLSKEIGDYYTMVSEIFSTVSLSLSRLEQMVKMVLGETQQLSSFFFYITFIVATFILTFPMRTSRGRMKILCATLLHFLLEKLLLTCVYSLAPEYSNHIMGVFYYTRFILLLISLFILIHTGYHYNDYGKLLITIDTKLDQERIENERFREDIRNEIKLNNSSLHEKFDRFSTPVKSVSDSKHKFPKSRHSIHRARKRLEERVSADSTPDSTPALEVLQTSEMDSELAIVPVLSPTTSIDYDSGVEDCTSRKELQLSVPKFDLSAYYSPRSSPISEIPLKSTPSRLKSKSNTPYNLRARK